MSKSNNRGSRPPPTLQRIPILQLEKLTESETGKMQGDKVYEELSEQSESDKAALERETVTSPPQLESFLEQEQNAADSTEVIESESSESKDIEEISKPEISENKDIAEPPAENITNTKGRKRTPSKSNEPRKIIQSIFAKPKQLKPRRSRRAKGKKTKPIPRLKPQGSLLSKSKYIPSGNRVGRPSRQQQQQSSSDNENIADPPADEPPPTFESFQMDTESIGEGDDISKSGQDLSDDNKSGSLSGDVNDEVNEEGDDERTSRKSDDEDDNLFSSEIDQEDDWKPVRAAMVAAMELVAKKQVTDDMRVERRIRKHNTKPLPPKGRGRRTIFKKASKPIQSCMETEGPSVVSSMFFNKLFHQKGDIVALSTDLDEDNPNPVRFFQVKGFLRNSIADDCASLIYLQRKPDFPILEEEEEEIFDPFNYQPSSNSQEIMIEMKYLTQVMHCPFDFYNGHDLLYNKTIRGATYLRLGTPLIRYEENSNSKPSNPSSIKGDESDTTSTETSKS